MLKINKLFRFYNTLITHINRFLTNYFCVTIIIRTHFYQMRLFDIAFK